MHQIQLTKISPCFSVVTETMEDIMSAALGVFVQHGSRNESKENQGICNLIEHMLFKGTSQKSAQDIASLIEGNGIILDGFTTKEISGIYCRFLVHQLDLVLSLIFELLTESIFDEKELQKEKTIIESEIIGANEDPHEQIFNLLYEVLFQNHPLAHPISGDIETIRSFTSDQLTEYYHNHFLKSKICISCAGKIDHNELVRKITDKYIFSCENKSALSDIKLPNSERIFLIQERSDLAQIYAAAATFTFGYNDPRRYALTILNNILGGTMSSRFFQRLREQKGLVYTISSFVDFYSDIGIIGGHYISDAKQYDQVAKAGYEVAMQLKTEGVTDEEFERALNYTKAMVAINAENTMSRMIRNGQNQLILDRTITVQETIANYDRLTKIEVNQITEQLQPDKHSVAIIGQAKQVEESMKKLARPGKVIIRD